MAEDPRKPHERSPDADPEIPDLHLEQRLHELEALAKGIPTRLARRADAEIARRAPRLAPSTIKRRFRRRTVALLAMLGVMAAMASLWATLRQTSIIRAAIESQLGDRFGAQVTIADAEWDGWNSVTATGLSLQVPGWPGQAGQVASIRRAMIVFDPLALVTGSLELVDMEIEGLTLRVVERADRPGSYNVFALAPKAASGGGVRQPQKALLRDVQLEFGLLRGETVEWFASQSFEGTFEHSREDPSVYAFSLAQRLEDGTPLKPGDGLRIAGTWNERTFDYAATLEGADLGPRARRFMPANVRAWANRSALQGTVTTARIEGSATEPVRSAVITVQDVTLRERDVIRQVAWGRMQGDDVLPVTGDLSLTLREGTVRLDGTLLTVEARNALFRPGKVGDGAVEVPIALGMSIDLDLGGSRPFDWDVREGWLDDALATAKFDLRVRLDGLDARPRADGTPRPIELPMSVIEVLRDFGAHDWAADVELRLRRTGAAAAPSPGGTPRGAAAGIEATGRLILRDGSIRYGAFPYRLDGVAGTIEIDGAKARIRDMTGRGTGEARLAFSGTVDAGGPEPNYALHVAGSAVPLDDRLLDAFEGAPARIFTTLFDRRAWTALREAGLAPPGTEPGGTVDFQLDVGQRPGTGGAITVLGGVEVHGARVVLNAFPYPLTADGSLRLEDERVLLLGDGFRCRTPAGGTGTVSGTIGIAREGDGRRVENDLRFVFDGERLQRPLLAAIPVSFLPGAKAPEGWPGKTYSPIAQLLLALGVDGTLGIDGTVRTQPDGTERVVTHARLSKGELHPDASLPRVMRSFGLAWPGQLAIDDVAGEIDVAPEGLVLRGMTGRHGAGTVRADGRFSTDGEAGELEVRLADFPIVRDFLALAEGSDGDEARRAWDALQPSGAFDGAVSWRRSGGTNSTWARAVPTSLTLGGSVALRRESGQLVYRDGQITVDALDLRTDDTDTTPLRILAGGTLVGPDARFEASAEAVAIDGPLVDSALRASGLDGLRTFFRDWDLRGSFDAHYRLGGGTQPWSLTLTPGAIAGVHAGRPFRFLVHAGDVEVTPDGVDARGLMASMPNGWFTLDGAMQRNDAGAAGELEFSAQFDRWSPDAAAMLPLPARDALDRIQFRSDAPIWTSGMRVRLDVPASLDPQVEVRGRIGIAAAHFEAGTAFDETDGTIDVDLRAGRGNPAGTIGLAFDRVRVIDRVADSLSGRLDFRPEDGSVRLEALRGAMYGGRLEGRGRVDPSNDYELHVAFANVGFGSFADATATTRRAPDASPVAEGALRGKFDLRGTFGEPDSRRGAGRAAITDARMVEFPLGLSLLQLTQLMLPLSSALEQADIAFTLVGDDVRIRTLNLSTGTMRLEGGGKLDLRDGAIALRFRNRGQVPILSDLYGVMADQFFVIDVGGTFRDPKPQLTPIPVFSPEPRMEHLSPPTGTGAATTPSPSRTE